MHNLDSINLLENYVFDFIFKLLDEKKKKFLSKSRIIEITRLIYTIEIILRNLNENTYTTLRQIFYTNSQLFISQNVSNRIIGKITKIIKKPRELLNIYNSPKGIIRGNILLKEKNLNHWVDCMNIFEIRGHLICPFGVSDIIINQNVKYVLLIEKETIFFKLLQSDFINKYGPSILITAKGFPDINTRQLIFEIHRRNKNLKFFCLTDYDAYGLNIAFTYSSKYESKVYYVDDISNDNLYWLILFTPDEAIKKNVLKKIDLNNLSLKDIRILDNICNNLKKKTNKCHAAEINRWIEYATNMKKDGVKYEIDSVINIEKHINMKIKEFLLT
ncbi:meiotic recombination protein SPO11, putative [Plasmodium gallinaceum]|uniref:DNA topoisomerase (ATP-hydrolyzing) n=1 Tax=Plasmodium gallinaceum TaxID=5849 RepID=A0A1J1H2M7_PLAGA|nr:meiotic recombination protein SPO11, putative [Plasmodium gallinaceum]CRG97739.1 meiotic recombination protein SPO11, putative [Plasmodium gallinaceum]